MRAEDLAYTFAEAFYLATSGRPGPVHIDIPKDVFTEETEFEWPTTVSVRGYEVPGAADAASIEKAARLIDTAERPLIIAGHGVILGGACDELRTFAERSGIPVLNTLLGLGSIPRTHVLSYGMMGMHGSYEANMAASNADVIIGLGNRMDDRAIGRFADFNATAKLIHVDIDPAEHNKNLPTDLPIVGDVKQVLPQLSAAVQQRTHMDWIRWIDEVRDAHAHSMAVPGGPELTTQHVIQRISELNDDDTVIVTGVGTAPDVGGAAHALHAPAPADHLGRARDDGLRGAGGDGRAGGVPRPGRVVDLRRRRLPDDAAGARDAGRRGSCR